MDNNFLIDYLVTVLYNTYKMNNKTFIERKRKMVNCPTCCGSGIQTITVQTFGESVKDSFETACFDCDGDGQVTRQKILEIHTQNNIWCRCKKSYSTVFMDDGECDCGIHKHHYHCECCNKVTQIG